MKKIFLLSIILIFALCAKYSFSQDLTDLSKVSGNIQIDAQYYNKDNVIKTTDVPEKLRTNNYFYFTYNLGGFTAGLRYEAYMNEILGYEGYRGSGIANRFVSYSSDIFEATLGNFYEQFGSGILLRSYEERTLAWDNSIDGMKFRLKPLKGIEIKGLAGKVKDFWNYGSGLVRGGDASVSVLELFPDYKGPMNFTVGGSVVSKYEPDQSATLVLPANVLAYSGRAALAGEEFSVDAEVAHKFNDPMNVNNYSYNPGNAILFNAAYYPTNLGISFNFHRYDNMDFRSDRGAIGKEMVINFLPTLTKQHTYSLTSIYPYSTQQNGEIGVQGDVTYTFPTESVFGGEYPLSVAVNYSRVHALDTTKTDNFTYNSPFPGISKNLLYQDANIEFIKRWSPKLETNLSYIFITSNREVVENHPGRFGRVYAHIQAGELRYKFTRTFSGRFELQNMFAKQDKPITAEDIDDQTNGNWAMALAELTFAPAWFVSVYDQYNYSNENPDLRVHYPNASVAYVHGGLRMSLGFGRQRRGLLCVGGICRQVPSANGFTLSITSSF